MLILTHIQDHAFQIAKDHLKYGLIYFTNIYYKTLIPYGGISGNTYSYQKNMFYYGNN